MFVLLTSLSVPFRRLEGWFLVLPFFRSAACGPPPHEFFNALCLLVGFFSFFSLLFCPPFLCGLGEVSLANSFLFFSFPWLITIWRFLSCRFVFATDFSYLPRSGVPSFCVPSSSFLNGHFFYSLFFFFPAFPFEMTVLASSTPVVPSKISFRCFSPSRNLF